MADIMQRRGSPMVKTVFLVAGLGAVVYLIYLNHDLNTKLKNTDDRAERYRRSHESLSAQLQVMFDHKSRLEKSLLQEKLEHKKTVEDLTAAKEDFEKKSLADREEMINRLNANSRDNKMIKSQHDDLKLDYEKLQHESDKLKNDLENMKSEDNQEYQLMKTQKELEISGLKDNIANQLNDLDKVRSSLQECQQEITNMQVTRDTALTNITKLQQDISELKAVSQSANSTVTNLQVINKQLQEADTQREQLITKLQQENQKLIRNAQMAKQNAQAAQIGNGVPVHQGQQPLVLQQQQQNGAVVMDQGQPQGGAVLNQNPPPGGVDGQPNQGQGDEKPVVPDVIDHQAFQIKPANFGGNKPVGYDHGQEGVAGEGQGAGNDPGANPIKLDDNDQHQVQPPNLQKIDNGGLNHMNPLDQAFNNDHVMRFNQKFGHDTRNKDAQDGHDNSIRNQGPVGLQVQEPVLGGEDKGRDRDGLEEDEDEDEEQLDQPKLRADHFMQNAHLNKQFPPRNGANMDEDGPGEDGQVDKDNYYEDEDEAEDEEEADDANNQAEFALRNHMRERQEV